MEKRGTYGSSTYTLSMVHLCILYLLSSYVCFIYDNHPPEPDRDGDDGLDEDGEKVEGLCVDGGHH